MASNRQSKGSKATSTRDIIGACADLLSTGDDVAGSIRGDVATTSSHVDTPSSVRAVLTSMDGRNKGGAWSIEEDLALLSARRRLLAAGDKVSKLERASSSDADSTRYYVDIALSPYSEMPGLRGLLSWHL